MERLPAQRLGQQRPPRLGPERVFVRTGAGGQPRLRGHGGHPNAQRRDQLVERQPRRRLHRSRRPHRPLPAGAPAKHGLPGGCVPAKNRPGHGHLHPLGLGERRPNGLPALRQALRRHRERLPLAGDQHRDPDSNQWHSGDERAGRNWVVVGCGNWCSLDDVQFYTPAAPWRPRARRCSAPTPDTGRAAFSVRPNPAEESLTIAPAAAVGEAQVRIYSATGQPVRTASLKAGSSTLNISAFKAGV